MVNLDADDPVDDSDSDSGDSDDDTAMLMAELQKIKSEKAMEEAEKVGSRLKFFEFPIRQKICGK